MKVTITIEDDGEGGIQWGGGETSGPHIRGPYIRGPHIVLPQEDGSETEIEIAALAKAAQQSAPEG